MGPACLGLTPIPDFAQRYQNVQPCASLVLVLIPRRHDHFPYISDSTHVQVLGLAPIQTPHSPPVAPMIDTTRHMQPPSSSLCIYQHHSNICEPSDDAAASCCWPDGH